MKISIRNKFTLSFMFVITLIFLAQLMFNFFFAKNIYVDFKSSAMEKTFDIIADNYDGTVKSIEDNIYEYERKHNLDIILFNDNSVIYASFPKYLRTQAPIKPMSIHNTMNFSSENYSTNPTAEIIREMPNDTFNLSLLGKFYYNNSEIRAVISLPMASIESNIEIFARTSMIVSLVAIFIGVLISAIISKSITKPIMEIERAASDFSKLDFSKKVNENTSSIEFSSLAHSINSMSHQLEASINELNLNNHKLQEDINLKNKIEDMRRQFIANVSHEMKTPLALLHIYASNLKMNIDNLDKDYYLDTIIEETEILNDMVVGMLDISSIESGLSKMNFVEMSLSILCHSVISKMSVFLEGYDLKVNIFDNIFVLADEKYIEQAMKNFITNAIDHTIVGDKIVISLHKQEENAIFSVYNQGNCIDECDIEYLWDSFYKSDKARLRASKNVGLGLHIVKIIIDKHNGKHSVLNTDNGVEFKFLL